MAARLFERGRLQSKGPRSCCAWQVVQLATALGLSVLMINLAFAFEGTGQRLGEFGFQSRLLAGEQPLGKSGNRFANSRLGRVPVPLPASYVLGLDAQNVELERSTSCYLRGQWRKHGWWYYYLYGLLVKVPLGAWLLAAAAALCRGPHGRRLPNMDEWVLWAPALAVLLGELAGSRQPARALCAAGGAGVVYLNGPFGRGGAERRLANARLGAGRYALGRGVQRGGVAAQPGVFQ